MCTNVLLRTLSILWYLLFFFFFFMSVSAELWMTNLAPLIFYIVTRTGILHITSNIKRVKNHGKFKLKKTVEMLPILKKKKKIQLKWIYDGLSLLHLYSCLGGSVWNMRKFLNEKYWHIFVSCLYAFILPRKFSLPRSLPSTILPCSKDSVSLGSIR